MPALRDLQKDFSAHIFDRNSHTGIKQQVQANGLDSDRRLQIYRNNVYVSLTESLRAVHPVVHKLVGDGFFKYAANEYITRYPSTSGDLHQFGDQFSDFLAEFGPAQSLAYLPDVARMEWYYHEAYHAADSGPIDLARLAQISPQQFDSLCLQLHPSARLLRSQFPILKIWQANQDEGDDADDEIIDLDSGGIDLLILRPDSEIEFHTLDQGAFELLQQLAAGQTLSAAVDQAMQANADFRLDHNLTHFVTTKALVDFSVTT